MAESSDLLYEIGVEELPASFVEAALRALPELLQKRLADRRLEHGAIRALGTPRRLAVLVEGLSAHQPDLEEEVTGPPVKAAFKDGAPTKAAEAFAKKLGTTVDALRRVETPKGEYLAGTRKETGQPSLSLLPELLVELTTAIPFRKSMRWGDQDVQFGRPIQWLVALFGEEVVPVEFAGIKAGRMTRGHRFLAPEPAAVDRPASYVDTLSQRSVLVDEPVRRKRMLDALDKAAADLGGEVIPDAFLVEENVAMVETCEVVAGGFDAEFLELPERVILEVAKGHQRYFGVRDKSGKLLPNYLSVVNTAKSPETIRKGQDRVMRARLADAQFFFREDQKTSLADRLEGLRGIVFQKRLGTVFDKVARMKKLAKSVGELAGLQSDIPAAEQGTDLCKNDLVSLMVGEFPELQGEMGEAYAKRQGVADAVAVVIREHYLPRGAKDDVASSKAGALVAIADRLDTLVGCFAIGLTPTGAADPYGLRRATLGILRTMLAHDMNISIADLVKAAYAGFEGVKLDVSVEDLEKKLGEYVADRMKGLLSDQLPNDVVQAALASGADRPLDAKARAEAVGGLRPEQRAQVGEVFKRATNIAAKAPEGEPAAPGEGSEPVELEVYEAYGRLREVFAKVDETRDYASALTQVAALAPVLERYFNDVLVMAEDPAVRDNRLRTMRAISETCARVARFDLLG